MLQQKQLHFPTCQGKANIQVVCDTVQVQFYEKCKPKKGKVEKKTLVNILVILSLNKKQLRSCCVLLWMVVENEDYYEVDFRDSFYFKGFYSFLSKIFYNL